MAKSKPPNRPGSTTSVMAGRLYTRGSSPARAAIPLAVEKASRPRMKSS
jgi:hypothetical protein